MQDRRLAHLALDAQLPLGLTAVGRQAKDDPGVADVVGAVGVALDVGQRAGQLLGPLDAAAARVDAPELHPGLDRAALDPDPGQKQPMLGSRHAVDRRPLEVDLELLVPFEGVEAEEVTVRGDVDPVVVDKGREGKGAVRPRGHGRVPDHLAAACLGRHQAPAVVVVGVEQRPGQSRPRRVRVGHVGRQRGGQGPGLDQGRQGVGVDRHRQLFGRQGRRRRQTRDYDQGCRLSDLHGLHQGPLTTNGAGRPSPLLRGMRGLFCSSWCFVHKGPGHGT
jgi:hypothetical protein